MQTVLRVSHLAVAVDRVPLFEDLSFELKAGETLVVLGPNGAGKTVLLKTLLGLFDHQGEVQWKSGVRVGYVPQRVSLGKDVPITVEDFFHLKGIGRLKAAGALEEVGLSDAEFLKKQLGALSSGQFQRVLVAWALVNRPEVLLFDEPTAGIDVGGEETIHDLLRKTQVKHQMGVILVTHDLSAIYGRATRVLSLSGRNFCYGPPEEVLTPQALKNMYGRDVKFLRHVHG